MIIFYIIKDDDRVPGGIYGNGIIIKNPYMVDSKRYIVDVKIKHIRFDEPIIGFDLCKQYLKQFRSVHKIESDIMVRLQTFQRDSPFVNHMDAKLDFNSCPFRAQFKNNIHFRII